VPIPQTKDFLDRIDDCYQAIALMKESLQIPEIYWHYNDIDIQDFTLTLLDQFNNKREEVDNLIKDVSKSWNINRMYKVDKLIIELAISEMISADIDPKVVISEALKIASKYSTEEGAKLKQVQV
jgi:N utilization substance protein B